MDLVLHNDINILEKGKKKMENNDFLRDLSDLMENDKFKNFFNKYMHNWIDIKCTTIYMRLYVEFKDKYKNIAGDELDKHIVVYILCRMMKDKNLRPFSIKTVEEMQKKEKIDFFEEFEKYMKLNRDINLLEDDD
jgi:hypothetical protein